MGRPVWMPGEPCWAMDGPSRRAHGEGPERGPYARASLFGSFCGCLTKVPRRKGETIISVNRECRICTPCARCFAMRPQRCRVHIHSICHDFLRVPPLRRVTFSRRRKSNQKGLPYHTAASLRLGGSLTPALSWGHAATGHPWPIAAGAASSRATPITAPAFGLL
ncbi:hypothetical protein SAMN04490201_2894 [Pseudomonas psychrophila]|uniref:C2H2-type domain-containing protein n=1 Tax=Pseudomonas psychrophila TaxID=122355 RepID=A0ABY0VVP4_9PSED|nr:hypothetical protein SAMN04490201_2894 [Pseudomonas psychrophila]